MTSRISYFNYFFLLLAIIWIPFQKSILIIDGAALSLTSLTLLTFVANSFNRFSLKLFSKKYIFIWFIWIIYSAINLLNKGYVSDTSLTSFLIIQLIMPFLVMFVCTRELIVNKERTINFILLTLIFHLIFCFISFGSSLFDEQLRHSDSYVNIMSLNAIFITFFGFLKNEFKKLNKIFLVLVFLVPFTVVVITATRKALGAILIFMLFFYMRSLKLNIYTIIKTLIQLVLSYFFFSFIMNSTVIGERIKEIQNTSLVLNIPGYEFLSIFGDRALFYLEGWFLFLSNPIFGIGLTNFANPKYTEFNILIHSEYMVQLTENGIIGFLLFIMFYYMIFTGLRDIYRKFDLNRKTYYILISGFFSIVFINFTAWTYAFPQYFAVFGVIIGFILLTKHQNAPNKL